MPELTKELIMSAKAALRPAFKDGSLVRGYEWIWDAICDAALARLTDTQERERC